MLMSKNVNNDVSKDLPIVSHYMKEVLYAVRCLKYLHLSKSLCSENYLLNARWHCCQMVMSGNTSGEITIRKNVQQLNYLLFMTSTFQYKIISLY